MLPTLPQPRTNATPPHPRCLGWFETAAVALGGSNQSLFLITALFAGQGDILGQGSAAIPLLILGLFLSWAAMPGWIELTMMYPNRVGGIAATCAEAFRPYSPILATLTGVCYWWGWVPTCGLTAILSATAINHFFVPWISVNVLASLIVIAFTIINLCGIRWVARMAIPSFIISVVLALISSLAPVFAGTIDWHQATTYDLTTPFAGIFGNVTAAMAGLYLVGFAAPAFEQSCCHIGEMVDPNKNFPKAVYASALIAGIYFIALPVVWLGVLGPQTMRDDIMNILGPTFAPVFGILAPSVAIGFMMFNMFHGTMAPLAGASRTLSQLADDGLLPRFLSRRCKTDAPLSATLMTAGMAIGFLWAGDPVWLIAAANLTYLIGICMPNVAVWLLRRNEPNLKRPYKAPRGAIGLGLVAASGWGLATVLGFQQFGLPTVVIGMALAYAGAALFAWRKFEDRKREGLPGLARSLHIKLTGTMIAVLSFDAIGYLIAITAVSNQHVPLIALLSDIFVVVALLTISVGMILPGMIAHAAGQVSESARNLALVTLADFRKALQALGRGDLDFVYTAPQIHPVIVLSHDELSEMADSFNILQQEVEKSVLGLNDTRDSLKHARLQLEGAKERLEERVLERTLDLEHEIATRKRTEEFLLLQEEKLQTILASTADAIITTDVNRTIRRFNLAAQNIWGYSIEEVIGQDISILFSLVYEISEVGVPSVSTTDKKQIVPGVPYELESTKKIGTSFPAELKMSFARLTAENIIIFIVRDISDRKTALKEMNRLNAELVTTARHAGMADVATHVLHNVGNVLNSISVSTTLVKNSFDESAIHKLPKISQIINEHANNLETFFTEDPRGKQIPEYLNAVTSKCQEEQETISKELNSLTDKVEHVKNIIRMQQSLGGKYGIIEKVSISELIQDALTFNEGFERNEIQIFQEFETDVSLLIDKVKALQILINLIKNARSALISSETKTKKLTFHSKLIGTEKIQIQVIDNGLGIDPKNITNIFSHGFTTKKDGHGFGLHSSAISAQEMGGSLKAFSKGLGKGATFVLELPLQTTEK